jgi:hypothetical protein
MKIVEDNDLLLPFGEARQHFTKDSSLFFVMVCLKGILSRVRNSIRIQTTPPTCQLFWCKRIGAFDAQRLQLEPHLVPLIQAQSERPSHFPALWPPAKAKLQHVKYTLDPFGHRPSRAGARIQQSEAVQHRSDNATACVNFKGDAPTAVIVVAGLDQSNPAIAFELVNFNVQWEPLLQFQGTASDKIKQRRKVMVVK